MERGNTTDFILKQFRKKTKRIVKKDLYTEFFYLNRGRRVIEFLQHEEVLSMNVFFKEFLPESLKDFIKVKILNDSEEEVKTWYYDEEELVLVIEVNWGKKQQEISVDIDIDNFAITIIDQDQNMSKSIDYVMFNDYLISFLTLQARNLAQTFDLLSPNNKQKK
jgi:hypothetical protein